MVNKYQFSYPSLIQNSSSKMLVERYYKQQSIYRFRASLQNIDATCSSDYWLNTCLKLPSCPDNLKIGVNIPVSELISAERSYIMRQSTLESMVINVQTLRTSVLPN